MVTILMNFCTGSNIHHSYKCWFHWTDSGENYASFPNISFTWFYFQGVYKMTWKTWMIDLWSGISNNKSCGHTISRYLTLSVCDIPSQISHTLCLWHTISLSVCDIPSHTLCLCCSSFQFSVLCFFVLYFCLSSSCVPNVASVSTTHIGGFL
jgi:hypothetical protein